MYLYKIFFLISLFFTNLSYSENSNQLLLIKEIKKVKPFEITDLNGNKTLINSSNEKVILINFWATWCAPCIKEIPDLLKLKELFKDEIDIYFMSVDQNVKKTVPKFLKKHNFKNILIFNDQKLILSQAFNVKVMPTTIIINKKFQETHRVNGYVEWLNNEYKELIKSLL